MRTGGDPEPDWRASIDSSRRAFAIDESYASGYGHTVEAYANLARWKAMRGRDPAEEVGQAAEVFAACVKAGPNESVCDRTMGMVYHGLSEYGIMAGVDVHEALLRAVEHFDKELRPADLEARQHLAAVHLLRAEDAIHRGEDPAPALEAFSQVLADGYRLDAKDPLCTLLDARRALLLADIDVRAHRPERPSLDRARELGLLAVERDPRDADAYQVLAEAERRLAALPAPPAEQAKHRAAGLDACTRGLAVNPNHPRLLATQGGLLLIEARAAQDAAAKAERARKARDALRRAVELNPLLRREVGPQLDEAERLSG